MEQTSLTETFSTSGADMDEIWDVLVIGAGLAGSVAACSLARAGHRTLLVDAKPAGRPKVCGGCLNQTAWNVLNHFELDLLIEEAGSQLADSIQLVCAGRSATWNMPPMRTISRSLLDRRLAAAATEAGATFWPRTTATVMPLTPSERGHLDYRNVKLVTIDAGDRRSVSVKARLVVAADGLGHRSLRELVQFTAAPRDESRIGIGATFVDTSDEWQTGRLTMIVEDRGYVGLTRVEQGLLNVAAAVDPAALASCRGKSSELIESMIAGAGFPVPAKIKTALWQGTAPLTRTSNRFAGHRLLLIGDAAGYVEPFTGEGMAWALQSATMVSPYARIAMDEWSIDAETRWSQSYRRNVSARQLRCRLISRAMRHPRLTRLTLPVLSLIPNLPKLLFKPRQVPS